VIIVYALVGFILGAPVNALADALPARKPVMMPGYLTRRAPLRFRDAAVHIVAAAAFGFLWTRYEDRGLLSVVLVSFYTLVLLLVTVTDLEHKMIPDRAILPAGVSTAVRAGLAVRPARWRDRISLLFRRVLAGRARRGTRCAGFR